MNINTNSIVGQGAFISTLDVSRYIPRVMIYVSFLLAVLDMLSSRQVLRKKTRQLRDIV